MTTSATKALQVALLQMQTSGVLPVPQKTSPQAIATLSMPEEWVKGAMIVRANSLLRGHSAIRLSVIQDLVKLIQENLIPLIPLRGSISASGDLSPLSYIAGTLEGNPDIYVWSGKPEARVLIPANDALKLVNINPTEYEPKEVLAILNGTAISASVTALATHEAHQFMILSQVLTAVTVEALLGSVGSFDPFIADIRPHPGQIEVAYNINRFLSGSRLTHSGHEGDVIPGHQLAQDRYATRTSSQWLGPLAEDLLAAQAQIDIELNSTTDNPLIDVKTGHIHHGGNFQAASLTSATEKTRYALHMIGRMVFAQSSELLNVLMNNGLPPNLAADDPSTSYTSKGLDINMSAYMAELAFLGNPVSTHVQTAEMGNQAINSLALVSARQTHASLDVLGLMLATHTWTTCQALDLRAMQAKFEAKLIPELEKITNDTFVPHFDSGLLGHLHDKAVRAILLSIKETTRLDSADRFKHVAQAALPIWMELPEGGSVSTFSLVRAWTAKFAEVARDIFVQNRNEYFASPDATPYLGVASKQLYSHVRQELGVPFCRGLVDYPTWTEDGMSVEGKRTTGHQVSIICAALRDGRTSMMLAECLRMIE